MSITRVTSLRQTLNIHILLLLCFIQPFVCPTPSKRFDSLLCIDLGACSAYNSSPSCTAGQTYERLFAKSESEYDTEETQQHLHAYPQSAKDPVYDLAVRTLLKWYIVQWESESEVHLQRNRSPVFWFMVFVCCWWKPLCKCLVRYLCSALVEGTLSDCWKIF